MTDDHDQPPEFDADVPDSLLPYDDWVEDAYREVMLRAIEHVAVSGLPGEHHFYLTFRTDDAGVEIPARLRAQYPHEMTIVLQHQFWDLGVDRARGTITVGLSFGGVGSMLVVPVRAVTAFADPHVRVAMRFNSETIEITSDEDEADTAPGSAGATLGGATPGNATGGADADTPAEDAQVVRLDAFRRKPPGRD